MNQGRVWCVVNPTVGLPLFLGSVAVISFTVHFAVLNNTTWVKNFFEGVPLTKKADAQQVAPRSALATAATPARTLEIVGTRTPAAVGSATDVARVKPADHKTPPG